jgi:hypothetical protein
VAFVDDVRGYAERAGDAVKQGAETAREKAQDFGLKRRENGLATDLGHIVFRQREGESGLDAEIDRLVSEMRGVRAEREALHDGD